MVTKKSVTKPTVKEKTKTKVVVAKRASAKTLTRKVEQTTKPAGKVIQKGVVAKSSLVKSKPIRSLELKTKVQTAEGWKRGAVKRSTAKK